MLNNKDFKNIPHWLMIYSAINAYNVVYEYSRSWGFSWLNIPIAKIGSFGSPPLVPDPSVIYFMLFFLVPALGLSLYRCFVRIKAGEISYIVGIAKYFKSIAEYFILFLLFLIFVPIFGRIGYAL